VRREGFGLDFLGRRIAVGSGRARGVSGQGGVIGSSPSPPVAAPRTLAPSCIVRPWTADHAGHAGSRVDLRGAAGGGTFIPWCAGRMPPACRSRCQKPAPAGCIRGGAPTCARASVRARGRGHEARGNDKPPPPAGAGEGVAPEEVPDQVRSRHPAKVTLPHPTRAGQVAQGVAQGGDARGASRGPAGRLGEGAGRVRAGEASAEGPRAGARRGRQGTNGGGVRGRVRVRGDRAANKAPPGSARAAGGLGGMRGVRGGSPASRTC
jgi:hypothetical protein